MFFGLFKTRRTVVLAALLLALNIFYSAPVRADELVTGVGHACGHNIICTSAVGAAIAVRSVARELTGRIVVIGTPAEEILGGKVIMARRGAFKLKDAYTMIAKSISDLRITY